MIGGGQEGAVDIGFHFGPVCQGGEVKFVTGTVVIKAAIVHIAGDVDFGGVAKLNRGYFCWRGGADNMMILQFFDVAGLEDNAADTLY